MHSTCITTNYSLETLIDYCSCTATKHTCTIIDNYLWYNTAGANAKITRRSPYVLQKEPPPHKYPGNGPDLLTSHLLVVRFHMHVSRDDCANFHI